jgi:hypothetical protein
MCCPNTSVFSDAVSSLKGQDLGLLNLKGSIAEDMKVVVRLLLFAR